MSDVRAPARPEADDKDWTWVLARPCPECGFVAATINATDVPAIVDDVVADFVVALAEPSARQRPAPQVWSPSEYACHIRDVCDLFTIRVRAILTEDDPVFANWDQDRTAVEQQYWAQPAAEVGAQLVRSGRRIAQLLGTVRAQQWHRPGRRSNGSAFTLDTLTRYMAHDLVHHRHDIGRGGAAARA